MIKEYGKWKESSGKIKDVDWKKSKDIRAGVDIGTTSTQVAILCDEELWGYSNISTGSDFGVAAQKAFELAIGDSGLTSKDIGNIAATGFGSRHADFAPKTLNEIHCHAKGARFMFGQTVTTVIDMGGQTCKAVRLYDWDRVRDFKISDKCATGMGRSIETVCGILQVDINDIGIQSLEVDKDPEPVSTTCYNFVYPETVGLFRQGYKEEKYTENDVYATYLFTIAWRILGTIGKLQPLDVGDITVYNELAFTGGLAKNIGIVKRIERELGTEALSSNYDPQLAGAIGAALLA